MFQVKIVVDESTVVMDEEDLPLETPEGEIPKDVYNPEHHIMISDARRIKKDIQLGEEMVFPLESKDDFGRIAAQTAKQVIMQKIREAERGLVLEEFAERADEIIVGSVERIERAQAKGPDRVGSPALENKV